MIDRPSAIAAACGFYQFGNEVSQKIAFKDKYLKDDTLIRSPNIGVVFHNQANAQYKRFAVECKFAEPYRKHKDKPTSMSNYLNVETIWEDIPYIQDFSRSIDPVDNSSKFLDAAPLIKHILGLK